jgi:hypothetical protein
MLSAHGASKGGDILVRVAVEELITARVCGDDKHGVCRR